MAEKEVQNKIVSFVLSDSPVGYGAGGGGTVTQASNKSTAVTLNKLTGQITMNGAALNTLTIVAFTLTNSTIAAGDILLLNHTSGGTLGSYTFCSTCAAGSASISVTNITGGSLSEAVVIQYAVIKAATT